MTAPTPLKWTRTPPSEAGWWWMKDSKGLTCPVEIRMLYFNGTPSPHAVGGAFSVHVLMMNGVMWSSAPIPPPEEGS